MIAVLFEAWPSAEHGDRYLLLAAALKDELEQIDGFIAVERFQSLSDPGKLLSLSLFRDEAAVRAWRETPSHRAAQAQGRASVFQDYRLRVAQVTRDYGPRDRAQAPG